MKTASIKEIKTELEHLSPKELLDITLKLTRFKKENKELLTYLLFEATDEQEYINNIKQMLHVLFTEVNVNNLYFARKNIRKILRMANRYNRYSDVATTEIEILIYICEEIKQLDIDLSKSTALFKLYSGIVKKISKSIDGLHEDLQYDYNRQLKKL